MFPIFCHLYNIFYFAQNILVLNTSGCDGKFAPLDVSSLDGYANLTGLSGVEAKVDIGRFDGKPVLE